MWAWYKKAVFNHETRVKLKVQNFIWVKIMKKCLYNAYCGRNILHNLSEGWFLEFESSTVRWVDNFCIIYYEVENSQIIITTILTYYNFSS